jgi:peptidoglycan/xylan/chitin deacetylase (PgdA/CDA1 family)
MFSTTGRYLTISVDDGHPADLRVAELLARLGLPATFYIPRRNAERPVITPAQLRHLATQFEIGSHTINHVVLTSLSARAAWNEITGSKQWVEDTISRRARAFCYPRGKHSRGLAAMVKAAGFCGARTVMLNVLNAPRDPYRWGVSTQAFSHGALVQLRHALAERNFVGLRAYASTFQFSRHWGKHLRMATHHVERHGGIVHLFLHGWEIAEQQQWGLLDSALRELASCSHLTGITNGELFANWPALRPDVAVSSGSPWAEPRTFKDF